MKLKEFDLTNSKALRMGECTVRINTSGTFSFSKTACKTLDLKEGSRIRILQDEEHPRDWYIETTTDDDGFPCRMTNKNNNNPNQWSLIVNSAYVATNILLSLGLPKKSVGFIIATEPNIEGNRKMYAIITAKPLS